MLALQRISLRLSYARRSLQFSIQTNCSPLSVINTPSTTNNVPKSRTAMQIKYSIQEVPEFGGFGLFAEEFVPKGSLVMCLNNDKYEQNLTEKDILKKIHTIESNDKLSDEIKLKQIRTMLGHIEVWVHQDSNDEKVINIKLLYSECAFINHAECENVECAEFNKKDLIDYPNKYWKYFAREDIQPDEQLFIHYVDDGMYPLDKEDIPMWFKKIYQRYCNDNFDYCYTDIDQIIPYHSMASK